MVEVFDINIQKERIAAKYHIYTTNGPTFGVQTMLNPVPDLLFIPK